MPAARIRQALLEQIESGLLSGGARLPPERDLSELFDTTRITVKEALKSLEAQGLIYREDRRGWFVAPERLNYNPQYRSHFHAMVAKQQRQASTRVLTAGYELASTRLCQLLDLPALSRVIGIRRLRSVDGRVVMYVEHHLRTEFFPGILDEDLTASLTGIYESKYGIHYGHSRFDIVCSAASGDVAQALSLAEGSPILCITRINYDTNGNLIDCDQEYWRHDSLRVVVDSQPPI